jgi:alpha,alpha-trehalose phosphorylase (configuration-retaining)
VGGIPLQIEHGRSGYLVERGDHDSVAQHLYDLLTDTKLYLRMSKYAAQHVSDEVHTVGNALSWLYLASATTSGKAFEPGGKWINDLAREAANEPYDADEPRLPRNLST